MDKEQEQKKFMNNLENEINELEYQINNKDKVNKKRNFIKNLKISKKIFTATAPYILTAGLTIGLASLCHSTPFIQDGKYINPYQKKEMDNKGNIYYEEQEYDYKSDNELYYYSKWRKDDKDFYSRDIKIFKIDDESIDKITKLLESDNLDENLKLEDILGLPKEEKKERKNNLTKEEINEEPFIKSIIYDRNEDRLIYYKETVKTNVFSTIFVLFCAIEYQIVPFKIRRKLGLNMYDDIEKIKDDYKPLNNKKIKQLRKTLEIKKENYKILKG